MTKPMDYATHAEDLAVSLERLLSQLSLGTMTDYVRDAYVNANNALDEYQQEMDRVDEECKAEMTDNEGL